MEPTDNPHSAETCARSGEWELPPELEREIFETTALLYPKTIPKLLRVARRVLLWIEPLLYNAIVISVFESIGGTGAEMLPRISTKGADFFTNAARHMVIMSFEWAIMGSRSQTVWSNKDLETIFRICTRVEHLLLLSDLKRPPLLQMLVTTDICPTRLYLMIDLIHPQLDFAQPFFKNVSHLALAEMFRPELGDPMHDDWRHWPTIFGLPALTHLALGHSAPPSLIQTIFTGAPHLEVLLISCTDAHTAALFSAELVLHDVRLVLGGLGHIEALKLQTGTHSLDEIWTRTNRFIAQKRRGEIPASEYYLTQLPFRPREDFEDESGSDNSLVEEAHVESASGGHSTPDANSPPADLAPDDPYARTVESDEEPDFWPESTQKSEVWLLDLDESTHVELTTSGNGEISNEEGRPGSASAKDSGITYHRIL
ncbi:hypothetical protein C8R44DRAFT_804497 [Mycena epipterygia]|nr:hypothetical protein C8R44DRAFT_804497 [Mycena epipterygia]